MHVAGNYLNKWMEAYAIPNQEASTVIKKTTRPLLKEREQCNGELHVASYLITSRDQVCMYLAASV